jgi:hypothetical protein
LGQLENSYDDTPLEGYGIVLIPPEEELLTDQDSDNFFYFLGAGGGGDCEEAAAGTQEHSYMTPTATQRRGQNMERKRRRRTAEKKLEEIPLFEFTRQVVELTVRKHSDSYDSSIPQREVVANLSAVVRQEVRFDNNKHLIKLTQLRGACKLCKNRSQFSCTSCDVALHPRVLLQVPCA